MYAADIEADDVMVAWVDVMRATGGEINGRAAVGAEEEDQAMIVMGEVVAIDVVKTLAIDEKVEIGAARVTAGLEELAEAGDEAGASADTELLGRARVTATCSSETSAWPNWNPPRYFIALAYLFLIPLISFFTMPAWTMSNTGRSSRSSRVWRWERRVMGMRLASEDGMGCFRGDVETGLADDSRARRAR